MTIETHPFFYGILPYNLFIPRDLVLGLEMVSEDGFSHITLAQTHFLSRFILSDLGNTKLSLLLLTQTQ